MHRRSCEIALAVALAATACSAAEPAGSTTLPPSTTAVTIPDATVPAAPCDRFVSDGCDLFGFVPDSPMTLDAITGLVADLPGELIAVWRTDAVCVTPIPGIGSGAESSSMAYFEADLIGERRRIAAEQGRTVITGWDIARSYWDAWADAWRQAAAPGVTFRAFAVWLPLGGPWEDGSGIRAVSSLTWRRTDDTTGRGELLLGPDPWPEGLLPEPDPAECVGP